MAAARTFAGVSKSGSPISRWMTLRPVASSARARAATSNALSVPIVLIRDARRTAILLRSAAAGRATRAASLTRRSRTASSVAPLARRRGRRAGSCPSRPTRMLVPSRPTRGVATDPLTRRSAGRWAGTDRAPIAPKSYVAGNRCPTPRMLRDRNPISEDRPPEGPISGAVRYRRTLPGPTGELVAGPRDGFRRTRGTAAPRPGASQGRSWRRAKMTLAGRSARRRMYHGYHASP